MCLPFKSCEHVGQNRHGTFRNVENICLVLETSNAIYICTYPDEYISPGNVIPSFADFAHLQLRASLGGALTESLHGFRGSSYLKNGETGHKIAGYKIEATCIYAYI